MPECAVRECWVVAPGETTPSPLRIAFHSPEKADDWSYAGILSIQCAHFGRDMRIHGVDSMQALTAMPFMAHAYLWYWRRAGFQIYWFQLGDFEARSFWGIPPFQAENPKTAGPLLRLARWLKLAPPP